MICKKCGCRVNDDAAFCDKCGASMAEFGEKETTAPKEKTFLQKNIKLFIAIAVVLVVLLAVLLVARNGAFIDEKTKYAIQATQAIQESLLAPDSLKVLDAYVAETLNDEAEEESEEENEEDENKEICRAYIYCTAQTRGGGITDDEYICYIYEDGTVSVDDEDEYIDRMRSAFSAASRAFGITLSFSYEDELEQRQKFQDKLKEVIAEGTKIDTKKIMKAIENDK